MRIDGSSGNVGIGTDSPTSPLHIKSATNVNVRFDDSGSSSYTWYMNDAQNLYIPNVQLASTHTFYANGQRKVDITSSGSVGIGTSSPSELLHINRASGTGAYIRIQDASGGNYIGTDGGVLQFFDGSADEKMRIDSSGTIKSSVNGAVANLILENDADTPYILFTESGVAQFFIGESSIVGGGAGYYDFYAVTGLGQRFFTNATERMRIGSSGQVKIANGGSLNFDAAGNGNFDIAYKASDNTFNIINNSSSAAMGFHTSSTERMRINASGDWMVSNTVANVASGYSTQEGCGWVDSDTHFEIATISNRSALEIGKNNANDGGLVTFRKQSTTVGSIGTTAGGLFISSPVGNDSGLFFGDRVIRPCSTTGANRDDAINLGSAASRFDTIFAKAGSINTSDRNEKQDIAELSDAEQRVAVAAKGLLRKFRWKDSVAEKGDEARTHFGIMAQDLQAAFEAEGLDAARYGMWCSDTWTDEETNEEKTRMGVRYSELLAFIIAAI